MGFIEHEAHCRITTALANANHIVARTDFVENTDVVQMLFVEQIVVDHEDFKIVIEFDHILLEYSPLAN
jgi:hypothetical protein